MMGSVEANKHREHNAMLNESSSSFHSTSVIEHPMTP